MRMESFGDALGSTQGATLVASHRTDLPRLEPVLEVLRGRRVAVLAGAGCSTDSGIPDYRGPEGRLRSRAPIQYQEFLRSREARVRYWSRSTAGWPRIAAARPNPAHFALAALEAAGAVGGVITQNVDGLHQAAGSGRVVELHGSLARVRCLACGLVLRRSDHQQRLLALNPEWSARLVSSVDQTVAEPDGDVDLSQATTGGFVVPDCSSCGGIVKPDVVFFGENVPVARVEDGWRLLADADVLLVVGSSLSVYSGRRFVYGAQKRAMPIVIVNLGSTRADDVAAAKLEARLALALPALAEVLVSN